MLWFYADGAGMAFAASVVVIEPLLVRYRLHPELREAEPVLSRAAGPFA